MTARPGCVQHDAVGGAVGRDVVEDQIACADRRVGDVEAYAGAAVDVIGGARHGDGAAAGGVESGIAPRRVDLHATGEIHGGAGVGRQVDALAVVIDRAGEGDGLAAGGVGDLDAAAGRRGGDAGADADVVRGRVDVDAAAGDAGDRAIGDGNVA